MTEGGRNGGGGGGPARLSWFPAFAGMTRGGAGMTAGAPFDSADSAQGEREGVRGRSS